MLHQVYLVQFVQFCIQNIQGMFDIVAVHV